MTLTLKDMLVRLLAVFLLIAINAFFVTAEFSMVSVRRSRISQLVEAGDAPARSVQKLQRRIDLLLSTTQFGITLSSLALGWIAEGTVAVALRSWLSYLPVPAQIQTTLSHSVAIPLLTFFAIAYLQIVLGELYPKSVALLYPEKLARLLAPPSLAIARFFRPFVWALNQSTRWLLKLGGMNFTGEPYTRVTPEELQLIIATSTESTGLEAEERQLLNNVFEFGDVAAEEVMIPRTSIVALARDASFQTLLDETAVSGHSRYPVMGESLDDIVGIVDFKDLAKPLAEGILSKQTSLEPWVRPARFISEQILLSELLPLMQRANTEMVIIVDEFGGTAGLVTIQDLVAEIIGESAEPTQAEEVKLQYIDEQTFLVQAQLDIEEVNELLNLSLPLTEEYQTLAGFMIDQLQKIPTEGEVLHHNNLELTVAATEGPRLDQVQVRLIEPEVETESLTEIINDSAVDQASTESLETVEFPDNSLNNSSELDWKEEEETGRQGDEETNRQGDEDNP
ncbi:MAG: hemolysin family protein [Microcoleaceae cyanobacterium]